MAPVRITFDKEDLLLGTANQSDEVLDADRMGLLEEKLGKWLSWNRPEIVQTIGPFEPEVWDRFGEVHRSVVDRCVDWLRSSSDERIAIVLRNRSIRPPGIGQRDQRDQEAREWFSLCAEELADLNRTLPPWYAGGFGHPDHVADFEYWSRMPLHSVSELTCLSVGIEPAEYPNKKLMDLCQSNDRPKFWSPQQFLLLRYEQLKRKFDRYNHNGTVLPRDFIDWAEQFEFEVHPGFFAPLKRLHLREDSAASAISERKQDKREVDSVAQLLTALAIDQLGYVPGQARSPIPKEIGEMVASLGMTITEETIRKYLRIGAGFISPDWKPGRK